MFTSERAKAASRPSRSPRRLGLLSAARISAATTRSPDGSSMSSANSRSAGASRSRSRRGRQPQDLGADRPGRHAGRGDDRLLEPARARHRVAQHLGPAGDGLDPIELRLPPGLAAQQAGADEARRCRPASAAIGQRVSRPTTTAADTPSARRSVRFSTRIAGGRPGSPGSGSRPARRGACATAKVTIPSANSAPSTPATNATGGPYPFPVLMACASLTTTSTVAVRWTAVSMGTGAPPLSV